MSAIHGKCVFEQIKEICFPKRKPACLCLDIMEEFYG